MNQIRTRYDVLEMCFALSMVLCIVLFVEYIRKEQRILTQDQIEYRLRGGQRLVGNVTPLDDCPLIGATRFVMDVSYQSQKCGSTVRIYRILSDDRLTARALMQALDNAGFPNDLSSKCDYSTWGTISPLSDKRVDGFMGGVLRRPFLIDVHLSRRDGIYQVDAHRGFYSQPWQRETNWGWHEHTPLERIGGWYNRDTYKWEGASMKITPIPTCKEWE